jgi:multiple sugar transport system permease protein
MLANSMMDADEVAKTYGGLSSGTGSSYMGFRLVPEKVSLMQYYNVLLRKPKFLVMFWNSVIVTVPIILGQVVVGSMAAFSFSKVRFPFRDQIFFIYIIVMMLPFQVTLVPNYIMLKGLNLLDTYCLLFCRAYLQPSEFSC